MQETRVRSLALEDPLGEGTSKTFQHSCLGNSTDRGAWQVQMGTLKTCHRSYKLGVCHVLFPSLQNVTINGREASGYVKTVAGMW